MSEIAIGVIGGSGLYRMEALEEAREHRIDTPFGSPSDAILTGRVRGISVAFLARHGRDHHLIPSEVPYRANLYALKTLGVRYLIAVSAVGSLREHIHPLDLVLPDQFIDLTRGRKSTFFGAGAVAHLALAEPICPHLAQILAQAVRVSGVSAETGLHERGAYVCIEGPAFSTRAESQWYRGMGADVVGMTNMPEAKLAREAEMAYATLALVTDYDGWHPRESAVTAELAIANLSKNAARAQRVLVEAISALAAHPPQSAAHTALRSALITPPAAMSQATRERLRALLPATG